MHQNWGCRTNIVTCSKGLAAYAARPFEQIYVLEFTLVRQPQFPFKSPCYGERSAAFKWSK